jgi:hypothetical protein
MKNLLIATSIVEMATGVALLIAPATAGQLLFGEPLTGMALPVARIAGIALLAFGIACWPGPPRMGMLIYNVGVAAYLVWLGSRGGPTGIAFWPTAVLHVIFSGLLATWIFRRDRGSS